MKILLPVSAGVESVVKRQLYRLGYEDTSALDGRVHIKSDCTYADVARLNVNLFSPERVLISLAEKEVTTFDELFDLAYSVPWEEFMKADSKILIDGKAYKSQLGAVKAAGGVVKKAVVKRLIDKYHLRCKTLMESGARYIVGVSIVKDVATITLDTSGDGLHKRGYRTLSYTAPLKETTASAMIDWSVFHPEKTFADVFCGSGTLPIEAALRARNIAPGLDREFDFTAWKEVDKKVLSLAKEEARDKIRHDVKPEIFASDINPKAVSIAKFHAQKAGVEKDIRFKVADMRAFTSTTRYGVIVSNPPYGERLDLSDEELKDLYKSFGTMYRSLPDWSLYCLTTDESFERNFGKRANRKRTIYNANLKCIYYSYEGKKPEKEKENKDEQR